MSKSTCEIDLSISVKTDIAVSKLLKMLDGFPLEIKGKNHSVLFTKSTKNVDVILSIEKPKMSFQGYWTPNLENLEDDFEIDENGYVYESIDFVDFSKEEKKNCIRIELMTEFTDG